MDYFKHESAIVDEGVQSEVARACGILPTFAVAPK
jgi:hypothetical protein